MNPHLGQFKAWQSIKRFVAVLSGTQGGKTVFGPPWLQREIIRCGPGDYLVVTPTFPMLELKALPSFKRLFEDILHLGRYVGSPVRKFTLSPFGQKTLFDDYGHDYRTTIYFGYAAEPESLESATCKAAWLDEAGQKKFKLGSWEAILRRLAIYQGRALITTTPYNLGWLKRHLFDRWIKGDTSIDVIQFESILNPAFPHQEWEDIQSRLPDWKFNMYYKAIFDKPAGLIYDVFDSSTHIKPRFNIPLNWKRYLGLDFGGVNTAGCFYAEDPETNFLYLYKTYKSGNKTASEHVTDLYKDEDKNNLTVVGGSWSEDQWRREFKSGGMNVKPPSIDSVEVGLDRVYGLHKTNKLFILEGSEDYVEEKTTYSRSLDSNNDPTEEIEDKNTFHLMDAERYILSWIIQQQSRRKARSLSGGH